MFVDLVPAGVAVAWTGEWDWPPGTPGCRISQVSKMISHDPNTAATRLGPMPDNERGSLSRKEVQADAALLDKPWPCRYVRPVHTAGAPTRRSRPSRTTMVWGLRCRMDLRRVPTTVRPSSPSWACLIPSVIERPRDRNRPSHPALLLLGHRFEAYPLLCRCNQHEEADTELGQGPCRRRHQSIAWGFWLLGGI